MNKRLLNENNSNRFRLSEMYQTKYELHTNVMNWRFVCLYFSRICYTSEVYFKNVVEEREMSNPSIYTSFAQPNEQ